MLTAARLSGKVGMLVLMSTKAHPRWRQSRKQEEKYYGPYLVEALQGPNALKLRGLPPDVPPIVNVSYLRPFLESPPEFSCSSGARGGLGNFSCVLRTRVGTGGHY